MLCFILLVFYSSSATCSQLQSRHRRWILDPFTIEEEHPGPFPYVLGKINVVETNGRHFKLYGEGVDEEPKGVLSIHKETGTVSVHRAVDYETKTMLKLRFEATGNDLQSAKLGVEISILDINDNPPRFQKDRYDISVNEKTTQGSYLLTLVAFDRDKKDTPNSTFHFEIKSVAPNPPDTKFTIDKSGSISFNGCLDHEVAEMFTVVVEAKDHGDVVSLSSSTTVVIHVEDGNNHLPTITGQTGSGKVKEYETGTSPLRVHASDKDTRNSAAWRAKYTIQGDEREHFKIETDPNTNDGILTVIKPIDFEEKAQMELTISVENEAPYFYCKVREKTHSGLWKVDTSKGDDDPQPHSVKVIIQVEDTNDPPLFSVTIKEAMLEENTPIGTWVEKMTAVDPDSSHARDFVYKVGNDPAGWVTVDPHTGDITTSKTPDRESLHVVNGIYTILLHAVDNGKPPLTGTATLNIHVSDQNDNVPQPTLDYVDVCLSDGPTTTNITAFDLDDSPFGGPFTFELLGDVNGKWKLNPSYGYIAGLVKEPSVFAGPHTIDLKISDMQGKFGVYNLSVTVCDCSVNSTCRGRGGTATKAVYGAIGIVFVSLLLLLFLLMAVFMSCKTVFHPLEISDSSNSTILVSNIETPGRDCKVPFLALSTDNMHYHPSKRQHSTSSKMQWAAKNFRRENVSYRVNDNCNQEAWNYPIANGHHRNHQIDDMSTMDFPYKRNASSSVDTALLALLKERLSHQTGRSDEVLPHLYADEGDSDIISELDNIDIPDEDSFEKVLEVLGPKFMQLAAICMPPHTQKQ